MIHSPLKKLSVSCAVAVIGSIVGTPPAHAQKPDLEPLEGSQLDRVYVKPGVDFSKYKKIQIAPVGIWYQSDFEPDPVNIQRMQTWFYAAISSAVSDAYEVVAEPGPDVMRIQAQVIDLKINSTNPDPSMFEHYQFDVREGQMTLVGELRDSMTGEVLVRGADLEKDAATEAEHDDRVNWEQVQITFRRWARIFRAWLDEMHR